MPADHEQIARELAILVDLHRDADPGLASLAAAIYLEDVADVTLTDAELEAGVLDRDVLDRILPGASETT